MSAQVLSEAARRRTFAIISHPDAGKTTLTEKFLLYAGAITSGGAVKAHEGRRAATSDWMEMEQTRGISITSTALQLPVPRPRTQPARHPRPPRLLRGHLPGAVGGRRRGDGARLRQGHRAPDPQAVRGLPVPQPAGHHVPQQARSTGDGASRAARPDRGADRPAADAGDVAGRLVRRSPRCDRPSYGRVHPVHPHREGFADRSRGGRAGRPCRHRGGKRLDQEHRGDRVAQRDGGRRRPAVVPRR